jgi:hypothetical protein
MVLLKNEKRFHYRPPRLGYASNHEPRMKTTKRKTTENGTMTILDKPRNNQRARLLQTLLAGLPVLLTSLAKHI